MDVCVPSSLDSSTLPNKLLYIINKLTRSKVAARPWIRACVPRRTKCRGMVEDGSELTRYPSSSWRSPHQILSDVEAKKKH